MVSPYLERPLRSYEEALRDRAARLAAMGHHPVETDVEPAAAVAIDDPAPVAVATDIDGRHEPVLSFDDMLSDSSASTLPLFGPYDTSVIPVDVAPLPVGLIPLRDLDLIDLGLPSFAFG